MAGIGKTELARKYIENYGEQYSTDIYWINAENTQNIANMQAFYKNELMEKLKKINKVLIVLDNVNTLEDARMLVPKQRLDNLHVLITSRITVWKMHVEEKIESVRLSDFKEAYELIKNSFPSGKNEDINELIDTLEGLPLALQQAIAYIKNRQNKIRNYTIKDYLKEFGENTKALLNADMFKDCLIDSDRYNFKTVFTTFNISFELIKKEKEYGKEAEEIMYFIAYLKPNFDIFKYFTNENELYILEKYSLIKISGEEASVHRLVQEVARLKILNVPNLEETVLRQLIFSKDIFKRANLIVFSERLQNKQYVHILKQYCYKTPIDEIPFFNIFEFGGEKTFETMVMEKCFNWGEKNAKKTVLKNIEFILEKCDVNIVCELLKELEDKNLIYDLISYCIKNKGKMNFKEIKRQTFKLLVLLYKSEKRGETLQYLSQINNINLPIILEMAQTYVEKLSLNQDLLQLAIDCDHPGILDYILKHLKQDGMQHLKYAIDEKKENAFYKLANEYFQSNQDSILMNEEKDEKGLNLYDFACLHGTLNIVNHLKCAGFKNSDNFTFHLDYYISCKFDVFKYMFNNNTIDWLGRTVLFYAARVRRVDLLECMIEETDLKSIIATEEDKEGNSLLHYTVSNCDMNTHIEKHYVLTGRNYTENTNKTDIIKFLIKEGVNPSKLNAHGQTALMVAAYCHNKDVIECLLSITDCAVSFLINQCDVDGRTPLHYAAMRGNYDEITNVIKPQLHSTIPSFSLKQTFYSTYLHGNTIKIILNYCADNVNVKDNFGCCPTHYACMHFLIPIDCESFGFKSEEWSSLKDNQGNTPLHYAAIAPNIRLLYELSEEDKANNYSKLIVVSNQQNQNLLHFLAISTRRIEPFHTYTFAYTYNDYTDVLNWLIKEKHLDINQKDINGLTPIDYAHKSDNQQFIRNIKKITS